MAAEVARAGIFGPRIFRDEVLVSLLPRHWRIDDLLGLDDESKRRRDDLHAFVDLLNRRIARREFLATT